MTITALVWDNEKAALDTVTEKIPARIDQHFETLIPARSFRDWLHATLPTKQEKAVNASQQLNFTYDPAVEIVTIKAGNTRAQFKCISAQEFPA